MIKTVAAFFDKLMIKYTPDTFILALFLTTLTILGALFLTDTSFSDLMVYWGTVFGRLCHILC
ncbi:MAG: TIGR00366 family protein [Holosporaceae bacterium]|nr:MAG: TIGR00366 family protein [Holosporaceae bacterium]